MTPRRSRHGWWWIASILPLLLTDCGGRGPEGVYKVGSPYQVAGRWYHPSFDPDYDRVGTASWYGPNFQGRPTANGEVFDRDELSAAHPTLPLPSIVKVTNLGNGRDLVVRVNDRGPFVDDRIIDMSQAAARELGFERQGTARVRVQFIRMADDARGRPPQPPARRSSAPRQVAAAPAPAAPRALEPPPPPALATAAGNRCAGRFIQVGAYAQAERAHQIAIQLLGLAWPVSLEESEADWLARIRLGPIDDRRAAAATLRWLKGEGYASAFIVDHEASTSAAC